MLDLKITDVRALPGDSGFLIDDGKTSILYDSGFAFTGYTVAENIKRELGGRKLDYIFLTHSHYDHALGSAYALKYWPDAKVVAGEYAAKIFKKDSAKAVMRNLDKKFSHASGVTEYDDLIDNLHVDIEVADGDRILAGDMEFLAIHLPGHTRCSTGYYCCDKKLLLGCETIGVYGGGDIVVPSYLVGYKTTMESIKKVKALDIEYILTPHYGILNKEQTKAYVENAEKNAEEVALTISYMAKRGYEKSEIFDYFKDEVVTIKNTIPTAEGAIATAIKETDTTLFGSKCLILGYGKVAKTLAGYLGCFGAKVTIAARKETDRVLASINLLDSMIINELENEIHKYDIIFNTIPVKIIDSHILRKVRNEALIIDLASKPGGVDFKEAELLKKRVVWALGLPGKYAYKTAALYIYDYIINVIKGDEL